MRIVALEPYYTGSHRDWLDGYVRESAHEVVALTLPGQFWKWRMHGGAVTLARRLREARERPDLLLATDMLDLSTFLALTRDRTHALPVALYMHENQLTYPLRPGEKRHLHYGFINYASMLCADAILFNSAYHLESWFEELPRLLKHYPDYTEMETVQALRERSRVFPVGMDLRWLDRCRPEQRRQGPLLILWNHRWEYDKAPEMFTRALYALADRDVSFEVALLGEHFVSEPAVFAEARERLGHRIVQYGYTPSREDYARWLWDADVVVSTARHEFFGVAVAEALYCGCFPILPNRLTYPQFIPEPDRGLCLYRTLAELADRLAWAAQNLELVRARSWRSSVSVYDWGALATSLDTTLAALAPATGDVTA